MTQTIFPGITLSYINIHSPTVQRTQCKTADPSCWEIIHCKEGRMESIVAGQLCYLEQGDLLISGKGLREDKLSFPLRHFHGLSLCFDLQNAAHCFSCCLQGVQIDPERIRSRLLGEKELCIIRASASVEHLFSELYAVPDSIREGYCKVKLLELMLFLSVADKAADHAKDHTCTRQQSDLAKGIASYLTRHMEDKVTLSDLTREFHASGTHIKQCFRTVYGVSVGNYLKTLKMEAAAYMLEHTDRSVTEIAAAHGYDNASKFSIAFRGIKGLSPTEYRRQNNGMHPVPDALLREKLEKAGYRLRP